MHHFEWTQTVCPLTLNCVAVLQVEKHVVSLLLAVAVFLVLCLRPPSHQTKTMKTALRPENFNERSVVVVKKEKCAVFKFYTTSLLRPGQVLTAPNTSLSGSYCV